ncbi:dihydropteroate synthase [Nocardioides sp.]|uniref:dihydropteroate synthase n=1 Tax=Nocardioides sp. TaxID=35761 RepID=UPI00286B1445|nr:dihydropteroate synthase [Nocardioides sp.]
MISLAALAEMAEAHRDTLDAPVAPVVLGDRVIDSDTTPVVMATLNLSRDSTYRDSIATSTESAIRRGRIFAAQGADLVDIGAESTNAAATRVERQGQVDKLVPVIKALADSDVVVSAETYHPDVAEACLKAGAKVLNFTGAEHQEEFFDLAVAYDATVILCSVLGSNVRDVADVEREEDPFPGFVDHFTDRIAQARSQGLERIIIDPGLGFFYGNLTVPSVRVDFQTRVILQTFRLRSLGLPVCHALPHAFDLFQEQFREAEPMFAVLAKLGGTGVFRTHEVPQVRAVLDALQFLQVR